MNLTISVDDKVLERARKLVQSQGMSLQDLIRRDLESATGQRPAEAVASELLQLMNEHGGHSGP